MVMPAKPHTEDFLRLVIDRIPTMVWSLTPEGVLDFVNQRWLDYTGISFEEAIQEPNGIVHPEDLSRVMGKWLKDMAAGESSEDEMRLRRAGGEYRWFLIRDRKSTRLNSSHDQISYAVFCLKKKKKNRKQQNAKYEHCIIESHHRT